MKLEVGMYVRTKDGRISKMTRIKIDIELKLTFYCFEENTIHRNYEECELNEIVLKASYNIIDILEVGDYVNGLKITSVDKTIDGNKLIGLGKNFGFSKFDNDYKITSIVTHEQMKQMEYRIGE